MGSKEPITVSWGQVAQPPIGVEVSNVSGLLLQVELSGQTSWLEPWTAKYFPVAGNVTSLVVLPSQDVTPTGADPLRLLANLYQVGDSVPSEDIRQLTGLATVAAVTGVVTVSGGTIGIAGTPNVNVASGTIDIGAGSVDIGNISGNVNVGGYVNNLGSGTVNIPGGGTVGTIGPFGLNPTDRSVCLTLTTPGTVATDFWVVNYIGNVSGRMNNVALWEANIMAGAAPQLVAQLTIPAYGDIDTSFTLEIAKNNAALSGLKWKLLSMPDEVMKGSINNPMQIAWGGFNRANAFIGIPSQLLDSVTGNPTGSPGSPLNVSKSWANRQSAHVVRFAISTTGNRILVAAPGAGFVRFIDYFFSSGTSPQVSWPGYDGVHPLDLQAAVGIYPYPAWALTSADTGGFVYINAATGGNVSISYHDEAT